jgi:glycosyltransferase involved in cell wall biosynthesis
MTSDCRVSVVVCTHNPRVAVLRRALAHLAAQTLPAAAWELLVIDNASTPPVTTVLAGATLPAGARIVSEGQIGLVAARLRGVREARADLVVFVDDDNLLAPDFLERALVRSAAHPRVGAFGGNIAPEFEVPPAPELGPWLSYLALRSTTQPLWANHCAPNPSLPHGAGLCVRREVLAHYAGLVANDPRRAGLDRVGAKLTGCGDYDLALCACDLGFGTAVFPDLHTTHVIPAQRTQFDYLLRFVEAAHYGLAVLAALRGAPPALTARSRSQRLAEALDELRLPRTQRLFRQAERRGTEQAVRDLHHAR